MQTALSPDETIFLRRALPHFLAGKSVEESLRAVLDDDAGLLAAISYEDGPQWCGDILGARQGPLASKQRGLRSAISEQVYGQLRLAGERP